jgi:hypothetical protein
LFGNQVAVCLENPFCQANSDFCGIAILLTMGLVTASVLLRGISSNDYDNRIANSLIFTGVAATFAVVWLRHHKRWAMVVTALAAVLAVVNLTFSQSQYTWPVLIILTGIYLLYNALRPKAS